MQEATHVKALFLRSLGIKTLRQLEAHKEYTNDTDGPKFGNLKISDSTLEHFT